MPLLVVRDEEGERSLVLVEPICTFGRGAENHVVLHDREASRRHFQIERTDHGHKVVDMESRNGTRVNDRVVNQHLLQSGDRIQVGAAVVVFQDTRARASATNLPAVAARQGVDTAPSVSPRRTAGPPAMERKRTRLRSETGPRGITPYLAGALFLVLGVVLVVVMVAKTRRAEEPPQPPTSEEPESNPDPKEKALYEEIRGAEVVQKHERVLDLARRYETSYPKGTYRAAVHRSFQDAQKAVRTGHWRERTRLMEECKKLAKGRSFADAIRTLNRGLLDPTLAEFQTDLIEVKNTLIRDGKRHYTKAIDEAIDRAVKGDEGKARDLLRRLYREVSGIAEYDGQTRAIEAALRRMRE